MPLKGFTCPSNGEEPGRKNSLNYCIKKCSAPCVSPHVLESMYNLENKNPHKGKVISVSQLCGGCKRKVMLERTEDFYIEPDRKLPTFRGAMIHGVIEQAKTPRLKRAGWLIEEHMELPVKTQSGEWTLSATLDSYDTIRESLNDVKTLQEYAVGKMVTGKNKGKWSDHISDAYVKQLNLYRYMGKQLKLFDAKHLRLQIIGFGRMIFTGTDVKWGLKGREETYYLPDVPILSDEEVESWIETDGDKWFRIMYMGEKAPVVDEADKWLCKICVFYKTKFCPNPEEERELGF